MAQYHAHVYFKAHQFLFARRLFVQIQRGCFPLLHAHKLFHKPVGPHALPMIELHFNQASKTQCIQWLKDRRGELSVLIHADSGDDLKDHSEDVIWLGPPLPIDFSFFERIQQRPELAIHSEPEG